MPNLPAANMYSVNHYGRLPVFFLSITVHLMLIHMRIKIWIWFPVAMIFHQTQIRLTRWKNIYTRQTSNIGTISKDCPLIPNSSRLSLPAISNSNIILKIHLCLLIECSIEEDSWRQLEIEQIWIFVTVGYNHLHCMWFFGSKNNLVKMYHLNFKTYWVFPVGINLRDLCRPVLLFLLGVCLPIKPYQFFNEEILEIIFMIKALIFDFDGLILNRVPHLQHLECGLSIFRM
jgi:hypothetical protein